MMKNKIKQEKGVSMIALVITVLILVILTNMLIYNAQDSIHVQALTDLYNDIDMLREKVSAYYNEYGKIPAEIKYTNTSGLSSILGYNDKQDEFYIIDLEAMQGITLNYGKDYEKVKNDKENANTYTDIYIVNLNSHNIFYVEGITVKQGDTKATYYTDYTEPENTTIDLRYIDGILIPEGYYYIGKTEEGNLVISNVQEESVDTTKTNQYIWTRQDAKIEEIPSGISLDTNQEEYQFIKSVNVNRGYFKNTEGKVQYIVINEDEWWSEAYTKEMQYEDINGDIITIPQGFRVSMSPTMNIVENGFVVKDSKDNEWVWVIVPESVFDTATNNTDYDNIEADLIKYARDYRKGSATQEYDWKDEYYEGCGVADAETYTQMYNKMLSSVYKNGGFWISRYEIGDSTATASNTTRTMSSGITGTAVSKANQIPYNYITVDQAQTLASGMSTGTNQTSSLLFGIQWDLTCKFIEENTDLELADINSNSASWGNFQDSSLKLNRGKYNPVSSGSNLLGTWTPYTTNTTNHVIDKQTTSGDARYTQILTTGASEKTNKMNIYDFAGNISEFTLEHSTSGIGYPHAIRGGNYSNPGSIFPAAFRLKNSVTSILIYVGFRSALY